MVIRSRPAVNQRHRRNLATCHIGRLLSPTRFILCSFLSLALACPVAAAQGVLPNVPWRDQVGLELNADLTDEFNDPELNLARWDEHGLRSETSGCPRWNGPINKRQLEYSTLFPSTTNPDPNSNEKIRFHKIEDGSFQVRMTEQKESFFTEREYYCDAETFSCNFNSSIPCYQTNIFGEAIKNNITGTYAGINHDKCRIDPYCIPHFKHVKNQKERSYRNYASAHISSKIRLRYGFVETRVWLPKSPIILAVWLHDDDWTGEGYCRFKKSEGNPGVRKDCPSAIRSRRWQEIDMLEQMNSERHKLGYTPNIHVFAGNKGEYTSADAQPVPDGSDTGGGPIVIYKTFEQPNPSFADVPKSERINNYWKWSPGIVHNMSTEWADGWKTVGLYWSPQELRFYIDGEEVRRLENYLVHQPMFLDISHALNVIWSEQAPTNDEIGLWAKIDYIRVWNVQMLNEGELDPPSSLKLGDVMRRKFDDRYGRKFLDVFNRFPYHDNLTVVKAEVKRLGGSGLNLKSPSSSSNTDNTFKAKLEGAENDAEFTWMMANEQAEITEQVHVGYSAPSATGEKGNAKNPRSSGKKRRTLGPRNRKRVSKAERRAVWAADDALNLAVSVDGDGARVVEQVKDGCRPAFDHVCPDDDLGPPHGS